MKIRLIILIACLVLIPQQKTNAQGIIDRIKMHRFSKKLESSIDSSNILQFSKSFNITAAEKESHKYVRKSDSKGWYGLMLDYNAMSLTENFSALDKKLKSINCEKNSLENILNKRAKKMLERWNKLSQYKRQKIKIERRYPKVIERIKLWDKLITQRIDSCKSGKSEVCPHILLSELDSLVDDPCCQSTKLSTEQKKRCLDAQNRKEHNTPLISENLKYLQSQKFINDFGQEFGQKVIKDIRTKELLKPGDSVKILVKRHGESIALTITPIFTEHDKNFKLGKYTSENVNEIFRIFAGRVNETISDSMNLFGIVQGEADANPVPKNSLRYEAFSDEWGTIRESVDRDIFPNTTITLTPHQNISNLELAFLRAYRIKSLLNEELKIKGVFDRIIAIDHERVNKKNKGGKFRCVTASIIILDFFHETQQEDQRLKNNIHVDNQTKLFFETYGMN